MFINSTHVDGPIARFSGCADNSVDCDLPAGSKLPNHLATEFHGATRDFRAIRCRTPTLISFPIWYSVAAEVVNSGTTLSSSYRRRWKRKLIVMAIVQVYACNQSL